MWGPQNTDKGSGKYATNYLRHVLLYKLTVRKLKGKHKYAFLKVARNRDNT